MDTMDVVRVATAMQQQQNASALQTAVIKKALEVQEQTAAALLAALPQPAPQSAPSNPPHLGQAVDVKA